METNDDFLSAYSLDDLKDVFESKYYCHFLYIYTFTRIRVHI